MATAGEDTETPGMNETLGIAGSGTIACGLAAVAAHAGDVMMWARSDSSADRARTSVTQTVIKIGGPDGLDPDHVRIVTDLEELGHASFLVEAVVEDLGHKAALLTELAGHASENTIIATTTSSLSIEELARATGRPDRFVGLHVFNPVPRMELVELVFPEEATESTRERARALCLALGKTPVEVPDIPGFVVNRLLFPYLFSAVELMTEHEMSPEDVDKCMTLGAGLPMGPIRLLDFVGLDVSAAIGESIGATVPARLNELVAEGAKGRKSGRGFYRYA
jgi:3-hydroxybutyryl-CoA dehydrogenase